MSDKQVIENSAGWLLALCERKQTSPYIGVQQNVDREEGFRKIIERLKELEEMVRDMKTLREAEKKMQEWAEEWNTLEESEMEEGVIEEV